MTPPVGDKAPAFALPDTEGVEHSLANGTFRATVVVWTCNHCPYALAWHDRIADVARDYADRGVRFLMVNSNDAVRYPRDSYDAMRERVAAASDGAWPFPFLHDASQEVARTFAAQTTPDVFVLDADGVLRYRGAPDADHDDPSLRAAWLRDALDAVLAGHSPELAETRPVGCSIKWKLD